MPINSGNFQEGNKAACLKPEIKAIRVATKENLFNCFKKFAEMNSGEAVRHITENKDIMTLLETGVLQSLLKFRETGEYDCIRYMLDQIIGRAKESIEISSESDQRIEIVFTEVKSGNS